MRNTIRNSIILFAVITICAVWFTLPGRGYVSVTFVSIGQGDGALVTTSGGRRIMVDSGSANAKKPSESAMKTYLIQQGINQIDIIVLSHYHEDHYGGIIGIAREFSPELILLPKPVNKANQKIADEIARQVGADAQIIYMKMGEGFKLGNEVYAETIFYDSDTKDENDRSLVTTITCKNTKFLFTGDITTKAEEKILHKVLAEKLDVDVIKVAHHGSKHSSGTAFFEVTSPEFAVISVGKNMYGHPTQEAIDRMSQISQILRTDELGTIEFIVGDNGIKTIKER